MHMYDRELQAILTSWDRKVLSLIEDGEIQRGTGFTQCKVNDNFDLIKGITYRSFYDEREKAVEKYGASNHLRIPMSLNISRAIRHIMASMTYKSEETMDKELIHVIFRLLMAADNALATLATEPTLSASNVSTIDMIDTIKFYDKAVGVGGLTFFPSSVRRMLSILTTDDDLYMIFHDIKNDDKISYMLDSVLKELVLVKDERDLNTALNKLLILTALVISCYESCINNNITTQIEGAVINQ